MLEDMPVGVDRARGAMSAYTWRSLARIIWFCGTLCLNTSSANNYVVMLSRCSGPTTLVSGSLVAATLFYLLGIMEIWENICWETLSSSAHGAVLGRLRAVAAQTPPQHGTVSVRAAESSSFNMVA